MDVKLFSKLKFNRLTMHKKLSIVCCLLFFLPFLQTCSDKSLTKFPFKNIEIIDESGHPTESFSNRKSENTLSGYELGIFAITPFTIVLGITFLSVYFSFINYYKTLIGLTIINIVISIGFLVFLIFTDIINDFKQIKYGYYMFVSALFFQLFCVVTKNKTDTKSASVY